MASPRDILELILKSTTPPDGYSVENYISVSYLSRARTQDYSIKLVYEYEKNATSGTATLSATVTSETDQNPVIGSGRVHRVRHRSGGNC